jgi:septal ring factor EnvC (AmiA/AmiB activator)
MSDHEELAENFPRIWLGPRCQTEERSWCEDPQPCDDCGEQAVEYRRADLVDAEIERLQDDAKMIARADFSTQERIAEQDAEIAKLRAVLSAIVHTYEHEQDLPDGITVGFAMYEKALGANEQAPT